MESKEPEFAVCIRTEDCEDLELRKVYQVLPDKRAAEDGYLRIIDESDEDYLCPESYFIILKLPREAREALTVAS